MYIYYFYFSRASVQAFCLKAVVSVELQERSPVLLHFIFFTQVSLF